MENGENLGVLNRDCTGDTPNSQNFTMYLSWYVALKPEYVAFSYLSTVNKGKGCALDADT